MFKKVPSLKSASSYVRLQDGKNAFLSKNAASIQTEQKR